MISFLKFRELQLEEAKKCKQEDVQLKSDETLEDPDECPIGPGKECLVKKKK